MSFALIILCVGQLFNAFSGPVGIILQMTGNQKIYQNILFVAAVINITLNISLIKDYGINGVAFATAISLSFWNISAFIYSQRVINKLKLKSLNS
jgi:O-antigen/teichoic acid export membrane protein